MALKTNRDDDDLSPGAGLCVTGDIHDAHYLWPGREMTRPNDGVTFNEQCRGLERRRREGEEATRSSAHSIITLMPQLLGSK